MSTFYVLPSRPELGERFARYLSTLFPGLSWSSAVWVQLGEAVAELAGGQPDVFVVYREDLPPGEETAAALGDGFGATAGDEVVEVQAGSEAHDLAIRRWRIGA